MSRLISLVRGVPAPLAALLMVGALLSVGWNLAVAPFAGFDEPDHVAYVARLAESGKPPEVTTGNKTYSDAESAALGPLGFGRVIGNAEARPPWSDVAFETFRDYERTLPASDAGSGLGPNPLGKNPPLYYAYEAAFWHLTPGGGLFARLFLMRLASGLLLLVAIAAAWALAAELFRSVLPRVVVAGTVALHPLAGYLSGIVNTDVAMLAAWTVFLWLAMRLLRLGPAPLRVAGVSLAAASAVLVHGRGLAIVPVLLVVLVVTAIRHRPDRRAAALGAAAAASALAGALLIYRAFTAAAGGSGLYGGEVNFGPSASFSVRQFISFVWQFYLPKLRFMDPRIGPAYGFGQVFVETWWGSFGAYEVQYPKRIYDFISLTLVGGALACVAVGIRQFETLMRERWAQLAILLSAFFGLIAFLHLASYRALLGGSMDPLITGRYLMPLTPVVGVGAAYLVVSARRLGPYLAATLLAALTGLSVAGIVLTAVRFSV